MTAPNDFVLFSSLSEEEKKSLPRLAFVRVSMQREQIGMSDFILHVSTPNEDRTGTTTTLSIHGKANMGKIEVTKKLAKLIADNMQKKKDPTFKWESVDIDALAVLLQPALKVFCGAPRISRLDFTTDTLSTKK